MFVHLIIQEKYNSLQTDKQETRTGKSVVYIREKSESVSLKIKSLDSQTDV